MSVTIKVEGLDSIMWRIKSLPKEAQDQIINDVTDYSLPVIKEYPAQNYVTRKAAYGTSFFSDKQRKYFFWALGEGIISVPYRRTDSLKNSWRANRSANGFEFTNDKPYAGYVMGVDAQSRHEAKVGWKRIDKILNGELSFRSSKFRNMVMSAVQRAIRKLNLG